MRNLPIRKHPRLKRYDYSSNGAYFITFCVKDGHETLGEIVGRDALGAPCPHRNIPYIQLSEYGSALQKEIEDTHLYYDNIFVDKFVVMPNHVHLIIMIKHNQNAVDEDGAPRASRPTNMLIPNFIAILKKKTNRIYGFDMWQRSYHDHIIRNESDYQRIWQYIDQNPLRWEEDCYYTKQEA